MSPRVFMSRPAALTDEQAGTYRSWTARLSQLGLEPLVLTRSEYEPLPWGQLRTIMTGVDGVVVLGFPRGDAAGGQAGRGSTPWNQIEAGMAIMLGVPVLVAPDEGIHEGVFSPDVWGGPVYGVALRASLDAAEPFARWAEAVLQGSRSTAR